MASGEFVLPDDPWIDRLVAESLAEDRATRDVSTDLAVNPELRARGRIVVKCDGVVAGLQLVERVYARLATEVAVECLVEDGTPVVAGETIARLEGPAAGLLSGERTALNFLQHLGGIATLTARYVAAVRGTGCAILDTRKTIPGFRRLAKYAVLAGGGSNHRFGLHDRILFKDNHWVASRNEIETLVNAARHAHPELEIEVEVDTLEQLARVLPLGVAWILLDNFQPADVRRAVDLRRSAGASTTRLEVSGGVDLDTVGEFARAGADAVSVGRLTHSAPALDVSLELELQTGEVPPGSGRD